VVKRVRKIRWIYLMEMTIAALALMTRLVKVKISKETSFIRNSPTNWTRTTISWTCSWKRHEGSRGTDRITSRLPLDRRYWPSSTEELNETGKKQLHSIRGASECKELLQVCLLTEPRGRKKAQIIQVSTDTVTSLTWLLLPPVRE